MFRFTQSTIASSALTSGELACPRALSSRDLALNASSPAAASASAPVIVWRTARGLSLSGPRQSDIPNAGFNRIRIADPAMPDVIEIVDWADTRHLADLPPQPTYDQRRHLKKS